MACPKYSDLETSVGSGHWTCGSDPLHPSAPTNKWYIDFVIHQMGKLSQSFCSLVQPLEHQEEGSVTWASPMLRCLVAIADGIASQEKISTEELIGILQRKGIFTEEKEKKLSQVQLVFAMTGLLTFFYRPSFSPRDGCLEMEGPTAGVHSDTWAPYIHALENEDLTQPLAGLFLDFGMPWALTSGIPGLIERNHYLSYNQAPLFLQLLETANLAFDALRTRAGIRILWTNSTCEHLEFNAQAKVLKLFRCPSFCAIMATENAGSGTVLSVGTSCLTRMLQDIASMAGEVQGTDPDITLMRKRSYLRYYREIILTFRIIFGQNEASLLQLEHDNSGLFLNEPWECVTKDPLLVQLCGQDWRNVQVYSDVDAGPTKALCAVYDEFPHFADRLVALHQFSQMMGMLSDPGRRDMHVHRAWAIRFLRWFGPGMGALNLLIVLLLAVIMALLVVIVQRSG